MTCTNHQVKLLMKHKNKYSLPVSAAKAGMSLKTARKYIETGIMPESIERTRIYRTRKDPFESHWSEMEALLKDAPGLEAKTLLYHFMERYPDIYTEKELRTLQRRLQQYRADKGKDKTVIFLQNIPPGKSSQSDWTIMDSLNITLERKSFPHRLFHQGNRIWIRRLL